MHLLGPWACVLGAWSCGWVGVQEHTTPAQTYLHVRIRAEQVHTISATSRNTPAHAISPPSRNLPALTHLPVHLRAEHANAHLGLSRCTPSPRQAGTQLRTPTYP